MYVVISLSSLVMKQWAQDSWKILLNLWWLIYCDVHWIRRSLETLASPGGLVKSNDFPLWASISSHSFNKSLLSFSCVLGTEAKMAHKTDIGPCTLEAYHLVRSSQEHTNVSSSELPHCIPLDIVKTLYSISMSLSCLQSDPLLNCVLFVGLDCA